MIIRSTLKKAGFIVLIAALLLPTAILHAAPSVIRTILRANQSTVAILAESGGMAPIAAKPFVVQETGEILIAMAYRGVKYNRTGSGIILHGSGFIAANHHVVDEAGRITVTLSNGASYEAEIVHKAPESDIAILKIKAPDELISVELADSDTIQLEDKVYLIGNSELIKNTLSEGQITGIGESANSSENGGKQNAIIEVNFELHKGDSGSPILNQYGECLGIVTAGREGRNATYVIPSNLIKAHFRNYLKRNPVEMM